MAIEPELEELFVDTAGYRAPLPRTFDGAKLTHAAAVNHQCHISAKTRRFQRTVAGTVEIVNSEAKVTFTTRLAINPEGLIVLPTRFQVTEVKILDVGEATDEKGEHHTWVMV